MDKLNEKAKLLCDIMDVEKGKEWKVRIHLYDESTVMATVPWWNFEARENDPKRKGWLGVDLLGQVQNKVAITLPVPIETMGHNISVHERDIQRTEA